MPTPIDSSYYRIEPHPMRPAGFAIYMNSNGPEGTTPTNFVVTAQGTVTICAERARYFETEQSAEAYRDDVIANAQYHAAMGDDYAGAEL